MDKEKTPNSFGTYENLGTVVENLNSLMTESEASETCRDDEIPGEKEEEMRHYHFKPKAYNIKANTLTRVNSVHDGIA